MLKVDLSWKRWQFSIEWLWKQEPPSFCIEKMHLAPNRTGRFLAASDVDGKKNKKRNRITIVRQTSCPDQFSIYWYGMWIRKRLILYNGDLTLDLVDQQELRKRDILLAIQRTKSTSIERMPWSALPKLMSFLRNFVKNSLRKSWN